jgi:ribonuclease HI
VDTKLEEEVPKAKASPYTKRWWTKELTVLRDGFTEKRNRVTTMRRRGEDVAEAIRAADTARRMYHHEVDRQKKQHWKDFLNNPDNIWKAARYAKGINATADIPTLVANNRGYCTDEEKAGILMSTFFPKQSEPVPAEQRVRQQISRRESPTWPSLNRQEVERAIFKSSPDKSPGDDGITFRVWRELWAAVGDHILWLYFNSLDLGHVPKEWKTARIATIRKPGKADYTVLKAFRPISLLQTISKGLEAVVAARMSYLTERFNLLPADNPTRQAIPRTMNVARQVLPLNATIAACKERVKPGDSVLPLGNPAWTQPPWSDQGRRVVLRNREEAVRETGMAAAALTMCLYTDASVGKKLAAIAVVQRVGIGTRVLRQEVIGWAKTCSVLAAELAAIAVALDRTDRHFHQTQIVLFFDSQRALRAIQIGDVSGSKRMLLYRILQAIASLTKKNTDVRLRWVPAHEGIVGNEEADEAARAASSRKGKPSAPALERVRKVEGVIRLIDRDRSDNPTPLDSTGLAGQYT